MKAAQNLYLFSPNRLSNPHFSMASYEYDVFTMDQILGICIRRDISQAFALLLYDIRIEFLCIGEKNIEKNTANRKVKKSREIVPFVGLVFIFSVNSKVRYL